MEAAPVLRVLLSSIEDIPTLRPAVTQALRLVGAFKQDQENGVRLVLERAAEMAREAAERDLREKARKAVEKAKAASHMAAKEEAERKGEEFTAALEPVSEADITAELDKAAGLVNGPITAAVIEAASVELGYTNAPEKGPGTKSLASAADLLGAAYKAVAPRTVEALAKDDPEKARKFLDDAEAELRRIERRINDGRKTLDRNAPALPALRLEESNEIEVVDAEIVEGAPGAAANA
ncbi:hypothetical protein [Streptomyces sp. NPDC058622]|uniref:hypothetical protein n=2 Tax=unclassified Streptomyces TaxID=2593676 RepID=UPI0036626452